MFSKLSLSMWNVFWIGALISCFGCFNRESAAKVESISSLEAYGAIQNNFAVLVDVREESEVREGMAAPAQWMPTSKIDPKNPEFDDFVKHLPKDKQIVFYCRSGVRSARAAELVSAKGFRTANMKGFSDWQQAGLPTKKLEKKD